MESVFALEVGAAASKILSKAICRQGMENKNCISPGYMFLEAGNGGSGDETIGLENLRIKIWYHERDIAFPHGTSSMAPKETAMDQTSKPDIGQPNALGKPYKQGVKTANPRRHCVPSPTSVL